MLTGFQIHPYADDVDLLAACYGALGMAETYRFPAQRDFGVALVQQNQSG